MSSVPSSASGLTITTASASAFKDGRRQGRGGTTTTAVRPIMKSDANTQTEPESEPEKASEKCCSICLDSKDQVADPANTTITSCGHLFCTSCLLKHLAIRNTCPNCRAEIEPARAPVIEPLTAGTVATIIREEETVMDVTRRIAVIGVFPDNEGRAAMILSLVRELAFGAAHSMAGWQGTDDSTYHESWNQFEYSQPEDEDEDEDDEDDEDEDEDENEDENENEIIDEDGEAGDDDGEAGDDATEKRSVSGGGGVSGGDNQALDRDVVVIETASLTPQPVELVRPTSRRALFQSPRFATLPTLPTLPNDTFASTLTAAATNVTNTPAATRGTYEISGWGLVLRIAAALIVVYCEYTRFMK